MVGVSQGGLLGRSIVEDCKISDKTKVRNLLTVGTPNMGVSKIPQFICKKVKDVPLLGDLCKNKDGGVAKVMFGKVF